MCALSALCAISPTGSHSNTAPAKQVCQLGKMLVTIEIVTNKVTNAGFSMLFLRLKVEIREFSG
jgi:hypothetical protein